MIWAKIKKAINSTLGTKNFKPLDKIIEDGFVEVKEKQNAIGETANSTLEVLRSGENNFSVNFANSVMSLFAQEIEVTTPEDERYGQYVVFPKEGLYLLELSEKDTHNYYISFLYYRGVSSSSYKYYATPVKDYENIHAEGNKFTVSTAFTMKVYLINLSF